MRFIFEVSVEVERSEGKFAARDEIAAQIQEALESADPGSYEGDNGGQYETSDWSVDEVMQSKPKRPKAPTEPMAYEQGKRSPKVKTFGEIRQELLS